MSLLTICGDFPLAPAIKATTPLALPSYLGHAKAATESVPAMRRRWASSPSSSIRLPKTLICRSRRPR